MDPTVECLIARLQLTPHPEGGYFRRVHESATRVERDGVSRPALTAIHYLLPAGETSRWHRVDADECWHWQEGDALELHVFDPQAQVLRSTRLESAAHGESMQIVPAGHWQAARPLGAFTRVACTVSPGFSWDGFELLDGGSDVADVLRRAGAFGL